MDRFVFQLRYYCWICYVPMLLQTRKRFYQRQIRVLPDVQPFLPFLSIMLTHHHKINTYVFRPLTLFSFSIMHHVNTCMLYYYSKTKNLTPHFWNKKQRREWNLYIWQIIPWNFIYISSSSKIYKILLFQSINLPIFNSKQTF